jgi:hypothetical protein
VAVRYAVVPFARVVVEVGVMAMLISVAAITSMFASGEVTPFMDAKTVVEPTATPVTVPVFKPTVAIADDAEVQVTCVLMSELLPSE